MRSARSNTTLMSCSTMSSVLPAVTWRMSAITCSVSLRLIAAGDGDADLQRALLGVGQHARRHIAARREVELLQHRLGALVHGAGGAHAVPEGIAVAGPPQRRAAEVFEHGHAREDVGHL